MSKVTQRKDHKQKLENFKQKQKHIKNMSEQAQTGGPQLPEVRNFPIWDKNAKIEMFGYEWEIIFNSIANLQVLQQATNSVMSRNIVNGTINMDFEKLNPGTLEYSAMTDEEKVPYKKEFNEMLDKMRGAAQDMPKPVGVIPETDGSDIGTDPNQQPEAKVVQMNSQIVKGDEPDTSN